MIVDPTRRAFLASPAFALVQDFPLAPPEWHALTAGVNDQKLSSLLIPAGRWEPYPKSADRTSWQALPQQAREAIVTAAVQDLKQPWPSLPASVFMDFKRNGNRSRFEQLHFPRRNRLRLAALAECIENQGRFLDDIMDGIWLICEESFWGVSAHLGAQKAGTGLPDVTEPIVDLFAAETANALAWICYLLAPQLDSLSALLRPRIRAEIKRRVLDPCTARNDFGWMGLDAAHPRYVNNWNPWINSNWLTCVLLQEDEPRRSADTLKILTSLDRFLDAYHPDGGCDEGPGYWSRAGASLFDCLELVHSATAGKLNYFTMPLVREIGAYIYRAHIAGSWYTNFADASARVSPDANLVWRYGVRVNDPKLAAHGAWLASTRVEAATGADAMGRALDALFHLGDLQKAAVSARPPLVRDVSLPGTQVFAARLREGSTDGFYVAAQGGHNNESHNHNDVGNFIVFFNGEPVLIDVGVETYTAKTFSSRRYEIWTMQSSWHNCPTINGVMQSAGRQFEAHNFSATPGSVSMNLAAAYPADAGVKSWRRVITLNRESDTVVIKDDFQLSKPSTLELSLITTRAAHEAGPGRITLDGGFSILYPESLRPVFDEHSSEDARLQPIWGNTVRRIRLTTTAPPAEGGYAVTIKKS